MKHTFLIALIVPAALALAGCKTSPIRWDAMAPASQADLDVLTEDVAKDRENTKAGFDAVVADLKKIGAEAEDTKKAAAEVGKKADEVAARPASGGIPGALVNAIAGSGVLPPWLDWAVTLLGTALGINTTRNASRRKALAKVAADKAKATPPAPAS